MKEYLFNLIKKHQYNISIYTEDIFERRCQEEIIRSDEDKSSFVYIEFDFDSINATLGNESNSQQFWNIFMETLSQNKRGSDILGFLEHESGTIEGETCHDTAERRRQSRKRGLGGLQKARQRG